MALSKGFFLGFAVGFGTGALTRDYLPQIKAAVSPLMKMTLKSLIQVSEKSREMTLHLVESMQDWVAETVDELKQSRERSFQQSSAKRKRARKKGQAVDSTPSEEAAKVVPLRERKGVQ
jgi:hypothetical protein